MPPIVRFSADFAQGVTFALNVRPGLRLIGCMSLQGIEQEVSAAESAAISQIEGAVDLAALENVRQEVLGKKSVIRQLMRRMGEVPPEEKPQVGKIINDAQQRVEAIFETRLAGLREADLARKLETEKVDITLPAPQAAVGGLHPLTQTLREIERIFVSMGYEVATGPDVETEFNNFDALNILSNHPARDMHDTFYVAPGTILRTHTSPVQIRYMKTHKPPIAIIAPGRVYRVDDVDATHSPVFHQVEGLVVDRGISMAHLKGTLSEFIHRIFGKELSTRFRPSFFPFTEPSAEVDMQCFVCAGKGGGCRICKDTGWIEVLGAGMVHPQVLENVGYDSKEFTGFAFGLGVERFAMLRHGIPTIRAFYENDARVLRQFA